MLTLIEPKTNVSDLRREWADWKAPSTMEYDEKSIVLSHTEGQLTLDTVPIGGEFLNDLAIKAHFPVEFVQKLNPDLRVAVINDRIRSIPRETPLNIIAVPDALGNSHIVRAVPRWRSIIHPVDVMQTASNLIFDVFGNAQISAYNNGAVYGAKFVTPYEQEIDARILDDILKCGIEVTYRPGQELAVNLFVTRLVCLNGMTADRQEFSWQARSIGDVESQLGWITVGVADAIEGFTNLVESARNMANTEISGDPEVALIERARAMNMPMRYDERLREAYRQEPGNSEWLLLNAFTRMATHGNLPTDTARGISEAAGAWTAGFDMVNARLPRPIANRVGATITE